MKALHPAALCLLFAGVASADAPPQFAKKPTVTRAGGRTRIEFAADRATDVAVTVEDSRGKVIRHLAAGVLGKNPPEPLRSNSLAQALEWDGKDDLGKPLPPGNYTVFIETAREHGTRQLIRARVTLGAEPFTQTLPGNIEIKSATLEYRRKNSG